MKKKIIISIIAALIILTILVLVGINYKKYSNNKRYEEIEFDIKDDVMNYLRITAPYCEMGSSFVITDETLIDVRGVDKNKFLDVDGKSYCKARIEVMCVGENEWGWDTYLKCKDYEDKKYSNWEE